jgi:MHS family alpha-ketoglutarate permease-like MFS transporter
MNREKTTTLSPTETSRDTGRRLKAITGGAVGNLVEWYDWYAYSAFSLYFAPAFFPKGNLTAQLLNTAGIFAVGFLMRPVGGWLFGRMADRAGRKKAMTAAVLLMSFGSLLIALTPAYATIGIAAPVLLLLARLVQGLSVGGEYGTSATYLSEIATPGRRGFYASFQYVTLIGGQLVALGLQLVLQKVLTPEQLHAWGWRIPFLLGAVLSVVALYLRSRLQETESFQKSGGNRPESGSLKELGRHPRAVFQVVGLTLGGTVAFYTYSTYMQKFLVNTVGLTKDQSTLLTFSSLLIFAFLQPVFGLLSDRIGRRPLLISFGVLGTLCTVPLLTTLSGTQNQWEAFGLLMAALLIVSGYTSINAVVKAELFPARVRALGVGLPYALTVAIFGGSAEYVALSLKEAGHESVFYWLVTGCIFISLLVYLFMKDTRDTSFIERE